MKRLLTTMGLLFGLTCASFAAVQAQGLPEENMVVFGEMPGTLVYSSGVGAWANELTIHDDGSFSGYYWDDDMGVTGEGYPHGTRYECEYNGQFEVPSKISDTIYETMLMYVETADVPDTEEIHDDVRHIYTKAYGISDGNLFTIYLAGTPREELPECVNYTPRYGYDDTLTEVPEGECVFYNHEEDICFIGYPPYEEEMNYFEVLAGLPSDFVFASGAGAWGNELCIFADGTFDGSYHDSEMGATGEGYPYGSVYVSSYHGAFSEPIQVDETVYEMELLGYVTADEVDTEEIIDGVRYIFTEPYGLEYAEKMILYLPGTPYSMMPDAAKLSSLWMGGSEDGFLSRYRYVLYNEEEDLCFFGTKEYDMEVDSPAVDLPTATTEYILPFVSTCYYSKEDIDRLTLQEVNYAKNEIYAIHGRQFKSVELQEYFGSKSWYRGTIDGNSFSTSVFNDCENHNLQLLADRETKLAGQDGYLLNQPGYDIYAVRLGYLDGFEQISGETHPGNKGKAVA